MTKSYTYCLKVPFSESVVSNFLFQELTLKDSYLSACRGTIEVYPRYLLLIELCKSSCSIIHVRNSVVLSSHSGQVGKLLLMLLPPHQRVCFGTCWTCIHVWSWAPVGLACTVEGGFPSHMTRVLVDKNRVQMPHWCSVQRLQTTSFHLSSTSPQTEWVSCHPAHIWPPRSCPASCPPLTSLRL